MDFFDLIPNLYLYSGHLAVFILAITVYIGYLNFTNLSTPFRRLLYYLSWNLFIEILARVFSYNGINNLPLLHLYTLGEFILFSWFYEALIAKPRFFKLHFKSFVSIGAILIVLYSLLFHEIGDYNPLTKTIVQIIIISYALLYFYNLTENQSKSDNQAKSMRLINSAVLIYYSGSLFIFMCSQALRTYPEWIKTFWAFNAVLNLIFQLLILWAIWRILYKKPPSSS